MYFSLPSKNGRDSIAAIQRESQRCMLNLGREIEESSSQDRSDDQRATVLNYL
jgi:hypothetical protein